MENYKVGDLKLRPRLRVNQEDQSGIVYYSVRFGQTGSYGPKRVDADQWQSVTGIVKNMIYGGSLRKYHDVSTAPSLSCASTSHQATGQPGDEARLE
ncbi:hypothetical protein [Bradyrhizobium hereditatis]|uniref:hypothetical protein n=1 Tax=Bradyrhizobium hereditatis TaxID=2821405 RepID=UPI001CE30BC4|nr:hypothetical protein [Bradyrhizobium hereditatis]